MSDAPGVAASLAPDTSRRVLATHTANFANALKAIRTLKIANESFAAVLKDIRQLLGKGLNIKYHPTALNTIVEKPKETLTVTVPIQIFTRNSLEDGVESVLRACLKFLESKVDHDAFVKHCVDKVREARADALVLAVLEEEPPPDQRHRSEALANAETVIMGSSKTDPEIRLVSAAGGDSVSVDCRNADDLKLETALGLKSGYKELAVQISRLFQGSNHRFDGAWMLFKDRLNSEINNPAAAATTLEKLFNIFAWLNTTRKPPAQFNILEDEFASSLKSFILGSNQGDRSGRERTRNQMVNAIEKIDAGNLLESIQSSYDEFRLRDMITSMDLRDNTKKVVSKNQTASAGLLAEVASFATLSAVKGIGHSPTGLTVSGAARTSSDSRLEKAPLEVFTIDPRFLELFTGSHGYKLISIVVDQLGQAIKATDKKTLDPFEAKIPKVLYEELDKALEREKLKPTDPELRKAEYFPGNETFEYLRYLSNCINQDPRFNKICPSNFNPANYALPFIFVHYFKNNPERQTEYIKILDELGKRHDSFANMSTTVINLEKALQDEERKAQELRIEKATDAIRIEREKADAGLMQALETNSSSIPQLLRSTGRVNKLEFLKPTTEGYLLRLAALKLAPEDLLTLNHGEFETKKIFFYLLTGSILFGSVTADQPRIFNPVTGNLETITRNELYDKYAKACKEIRRECAPDNVNSGTCFLSMIAGIKRKTSMTGERSKPEEFAASIASESIKLLNHVESLLINGRGWDRNKFGNIVSELQKQVLDSGFLPLIEDFAITPVINKTIGIKVLEQQSTQSLTAQLLGKMWKAINASGLIKPGVDTQAVEADLRRLAA